MSAQAARALMTIGDVLGLLRADFPDITISKIRFLETEGLVEPQRSPSGYRKFGAADVARLRFVLTAQRDHYLPLRVIRQHLEALDRGEAPPPLGSRRPGPPEPRRAGDLATGAVPGEARPAEARITDGRAAEARGADARALDGRGLEARGLHGHGLEGRGPDGRGAEGRGGDGRAPEGR
ncbi:transcriptional regulator FtsR, partial [Actinomadura harenae]